MLSQMLDGSHREGLSDNLLEPGAESESSPYRYYSLAIGTAFKMGMIFLSGRMAATSEQERLRR